MLRKGACSWLKRAAKRCLAQGVTSLVGCRISWIQGECFASIDHASAVLIVSVKAVFVDTDRVPARDSRIGDLVQNEPEARMVHQVSF